MLVKLNEIPAKRYRKNTGETETQSVNFIEAGIYPLVREFDRNRIIVRVGASVAVVNRKYVEEE